MLEFWLISMLSCFSCCTICNKILETATLNRGIIAKAEKNNMRKAFLHYFKLIIPMYNILHTVFAIIATTYALKNDKVLEEVGYKPERIKRIYKNYLVNKNEVKDAMVLDGASSDQIKSEIKQLGKETTTITGAVITEKDNTLANAMIIANDLLSEIECNVELNQKEKKKLLSSLRKMCLAEITGKKEHAMNPLINKFNNILFIKEADEKYNPKQIVKK